PRLRVGYPSDEITHLTENKNAPAPIHVHIGFASPAGCLDRCLDFNDGRLAVDEAMENAEYRPQAAVSITGPDRPSEGNLQSGSRQPHGQASNPVAQFDFP